MATFTLAERVKRIESIRECAEYIRKSQYSTDNHIAMQDVLATLARALFELCDVIETP